MGYKSTAYTIRFIDIFDQISQLDLTNRIGYLRICCRYIFQIRARVDAHKVESCYSL